MAWVKLDDQFPDHPKIEVAGEAAAWMFVCGLCYCAEHLTDGFIPASKAQRLTSSASKRIAALLRVGLWEQVEGGYTIPGYLEYQPTAEKVKAEREAARERMKSRRSPEVRPNNPSGSASPSPSPSPTQVSSSGTSAAGRPDEDVIDGAMRLLAERDLERVTAESGPRGDEQRWLATARNRRLSKHRVEAKDLIAASPLITAVELAERLEPASGAKPHPLDEAQRAQREQMIDLTAAPPPWVEEGEPDPEKRRALIAEQRAARAARRSA